MDEKKRISIKKETLDGTIKAVKDFYKTGDHKQLVKKISLNDELEKESGVSWMSWSNLINALVGGKKLSFDVSNKTIYKIIEELNIDIIDSTKEEELPMKKKE